LIYFSSHKEIPANYRHLILEETMATRIVNVSLATCNRIVADYQEQEKENEALRKFTITIVKNGVTKVSAFTNYQDALVSLDAEMEYCETPRSITAVIQQADRVLRAYVKGKWYTPAAKDFVKITRRGSL
jgi:hypothetical protein